MRDENEEDTMTPLDLTIDKIGMGYYQWSLLGLCGFGWLADNMWMEGVAISLPRVQDQFGVSGQQLGWLSSCMFAGMMFGALGWGNCSDVLGRRLAFNATLVLSAIFGACVSFAPTFGFLAFSLFLLGTAVGGSIPTDGTLFLENLPRRKRYLLTFLSVFFSVGAVVAALVAVAIIPSHSCPEKLPGATERPPCDIVAQNTGWKYMFLFLTLTTAVMFVCRVFFFQLYESPRYLVHAGRAEDAVYVLQQINRVNGGSLKIAIEDVNDDLNTSKSSTPTPPNESIAEASETDTLPTNRNFEFPVLKRSSSFRYLPPRIRRPLSAWYDLSAELLSPRWRRTTIFMWGTWVTTSCGYTLFNLFFPKLVELKLGKDTGGGSIRSALWNVVIYTLGGMPGSLIGAWMVETRLGKRKSLALSIAVTGVLCLVFTRVTSDSGMLLTSMGISLTTTVMWAVLYGMTPQMFLTKVRGTACGNASALNRVASMIAPPIGGLLLDIDVSFPTYTSAVAFFLGAACVMALPYESAVELELAAGEEGITTPRSDRAGDYTLLH